MKPQKRLAVLCLAMILLAAALPLEASANGPVPARWYEIQLSCLPEGTVYVDLLLPLAENDPMYTELVAGNLPEGFTAQSEIVTYCADGFRSYTFHYRDALSSIEVEQYLPVSFGAEYDPNMGAGDIRYGHFEDIEQRGVIRLAMLDGAGNILQVSDDLKVLPRGPFSYLYGSCYYIASSGKWIMNTTVSAWAVAAYLFLSVIGILATCLIERLMAWPFGLGRQYGTMIRRTNLVSQIAMRILYLLLYSLVFRTHGSLMIGLEILVYGGEYLFYHFHMKNVSWQRKLLYTAAANTASLVLCHQLNQILLYN